MAQAQPQVFRLRKGDRRETDVNRLVDFVMKLARSHDFECEVGLFHDSLTHQQRRTYRMWLTEIADHTGDDAEALHEHFLRAYAPRVVRTLKSGEVVEMLKRTGSGSTDMNKVEMGEYMTKVQRDGLTFGATLTQPLQDTTW